MDQDGIAAQRRKYQFALDMRHRGQINEVEVALPEGRLAGDFLEPLRQRFYTRYEQLYGHGSSYRGARLEIVTLRLRAMADTPRPKLARSGHLSEEIPATALSIKRPIYWAELKQVVETSVYDGAQLLPGNRVDGPTVIETTDTTVVVRPGRWLEVDAFGNFVINFGN